jgi:hypothetical protein
MNGHSYVDLEALARVANGSLSFNGNQITLTLPGATSTPSADPSASPTGLSKGFLKAGIEAMSMVREWHSALANAIQNGFPLAENWLATAPRPLPLSDWHPSLRQPIPIKVHFRC